MHKIDWSKLFRRVTTDGRFIPEIDGLRFVAILVVVLFHNLGEIERYYSVHVPEVVQHFGRNFDRGVVLFFVISGFVLALPFARQHLTGGKQVDLRKYFLRRLTRLEPPYIVAMILLAILVKVTLHFPLAEIGKHLLATLAYCHNQIYAQPSAITPVAWSLEVEVQFYIIAPLLAFLYAVGNTLWRRGILVALILSIGFLQTVIPIQQGGRFEMSIGNYAQFFLSGFLLADCMLLETNRQNSWLWDIVSLVGWPLVFAVPRSYSQLALPLLLVLLCWAAFHGVAFTRFFRNPLITAIGGMCYTIYLLHFTAVAAAARFVGHQNWWAMCLMSLTLVAVSSSIFFLLVEKPCMNPTWPTRLMSFFRNPSGKQPETAGSVQR